MPRRALDENDPSMWTDQRGIAHDLSLGVRQVAYLLKEGLPSVIRDGKRHYYRPACAQWYILRRLRELWRRKGYSEPQIQSIIDADPQLRAYQYWERSDACTPERVRAYCDSWEALQRTPPPARCAHCGGESVSV
jgi:hypothetical protein